MASNAKADPELRQLQRAILSGKGEIQSSSAAKAKRKNKKAKYGDREEGSEDSKDDLMAMTRLEVQPSCLVGGQLRDY